MIKVLYSKEDILCKEKCPIYSIYLALSFILLNGLDLGIIYRTLLYKVLFVTLRRYLYSYEQEIMS